MRSLCYNVTVFYKTQRASEKRGANKKVMAKHGEFDGTKVE